jgi:probable HAF family extracellular repeat protein
VEHPKRIYFPERGFVGMKCFLGSFLGLGLMALALALLAAAPAGAVSYTVTDLGTLGGPASSAWGINNTGQVVGESQIFSSSPFHAFLYSGGIMADLNNLIPLGSGWELSSPDYS